MRNSEISLEKPSVLIPKWLIWLFILVSFIGFLDATYLTAKHYLGTPIECSIFEGCERVTTSPYATVFNVPISLGGALYYLFVFILSVAYLDTKNRKILSLIPPLTAIGFLVSVWLVYLQLFVIEAICLYCMVSAATSTILFILGILMARYNKRGRIENDRR